jgi:alkylhydroperoxidase/carboxymuconolactone decarboxylase family protein
VYKLLPGGQVESCYLQIDWWLFWAFYYVMKKEVEMADCHYHKESVAKLGKLYELRPELLQAFMAFDGKVFAEGALSTKSKELIAVACAHITQCPYCIDAHTKKAKKAGATAEELAEAIFVAASLRAGAALAHSCIAIEALEEK